MKKILLILSLLIGLLSYSQQNPKLVVGIVVDQMRYDYIYRFWEDFGEDGFKKLINEGHFFRNCQFGYVPTYTGPGHASIFTGTTPAVHGIIANDWHDKNSGKYIDWYSFEKPFNIVVDGSNGMGIIEKPNTSSMKEVMDEEESSGI